MMKKWSIEDAAEMYNIKGWGNGYFSINDAGNVVVTPTEDSAPIPIIDILQELQVRDISTPVLLRFPDIIHSRISKIHNAFQRASQEYQYNAQNYIIYPIKVNQMKPVVDEILTHGSQYNIGLEAGSKPELHAVLASTTTSQSLIICNGYKDRDYISLALLAQKMGRRIYIVIEKLPELETIIQISKKLKITPNIGIRIKLASTGAGKWETSGGDNSKFGLNSTELLKALEILKDSKMEGALKLLHFHIGSQITKIRKIKNALREASHFYVQIHRMGFEPSFVDIGGGLGVDYDGTRSPSSSSSLNYTIQEYVNDAVSTFVDVANKNGLPHPNVVTESGRSLAAHHSILVFQILEATAPPVYNAKEESTDEAHELTGDLIAILKNLNTTNMLEAWHDTQQTRETALDLFSLGMLNLEQRAKIEALYYSIARQVSIMADGMKHPPEELGTLLKSLSHKYFGNFSLFQSLTDSWAIDQIFPIMPVHLLNERPTNYATLQDITCDSDGKIDNFISTEGRPHQIALHPLREGVPYYIGVFLVGAYQEILGDLHNLFGDTNAVHITSTSNGYSIDKVIDGESVADVLQYVQYNPKKLVRRVEEWVMGCVKGGGITAEEGREFLSNYRSGLYGYTYLE